MGTIAFFVLLILAAAGLFGVLIWGAIGHSKDENRISAKNAKRLAERQRKLLRTIEHKALEEQRLGFNPFAQTVLDEIEEDRRNRELGR